MTTPPVPQWAVDAGIDFCVQHYMPPDKFPALARIIAAHAPQGQAEDGERLDWLEAHSASACCRILGPLLQGYVVLSEDGAVYGNAYTVRDSIDAARKKDL